MNTFVLSVCYYYIVEKVVKRLLQGNCGVTLSKKE